jgi:hypothetical protein
MDTMHACDYIPTFHWPKKRKRKKHTSKDFVSINLEPNFSIKSPPYLPMYWNVIPSRVYIPCLFIQNYTSFVVQFKAHGKVALKTIVIIIM